MSTLPFAQFSKIVLCGSFLALCLLWPIWLVGVGGKHWVCLPPQLPIFCFLSKKNLALVSLPFYFHYTSIRLLIFIYKYLNWTPVCEGFAPEGTKMLRLILGNKHLSKSTTMYSTKICPPKCTLPNCTRGTILLDPGKVNRNFDIFRGIYRHHFQWHFRFFSFEAKGMYIDSTVKSVLLFVIGSPATPAPEQGWR